jgi:hypothetical protein
VGYVDLFVNNTFTAVVRRKKGMILALVITACIRSVQYLMIKTN